MTAPADALVGRLRHMSGMGLCHPGPLLTEAADTIERQAAQLAARDAEVRDGLGREGSLHVLRFFDGGSPVVGTSDGRGGYTLASGTFWDKEAIHRGKVEYIGAVALSPDATPTAPEREAPWGRGPNGLPLPSPQQPTLSAPVSGTGTQETVTSDMLVAAMQDAWDEFTHDTGCHPDCIIRAGKELWANFRISNFADMVAANLRAALSSAGPEREADR